MADFPLWRRIAAIGLKCSELNTAPLNSQPEIALRVLQSMIDQVSSTGMPVPAKAPTFSDTASGACDQKAIARQSGQCFAAGVLHLAQFASGEVFKIQSIITGYTFPGGKPEIAIIGLGNGVDAVMGKAIP